MLNRLVAEEHRPALERQAEERHRELWHHRPEQESASGSASSGPRRAPVTAQEHGEGIGNVKFVLDGLTNLGDKTAAARR